MATALLRWPSSSAIRVGERGLRNLLGEQGDALGHHGFFAPDDADLLAGLAFEADLGSVHTEDFSDSLSQECLMGTQFRSLGENDAIQVYQLKTGLFDGFVGEGQHFGGISALVGGIGIGKELAYVPQVRSAEEGVGDGVEEDVGVAVADEVMVMVEGEAAETERAAPCEAVGVVA
jgi:hypothetical protein